MAEVDAGKLASTKGNSDDVRDFGKKMVDDHSGNNAELKQLAAKKKRAAADRARASAADGRGFAVDIGRRVRQGVLGRHGEAPC